VSNTTFTASVPRRGISFFQKFVASVVTVTVAVTMFTAAAQARQSFAGIVVDAKTGKVLYSSDPDGLRYPASLTKMMTLYLTFEALEAGRIKIDSMVPVSAHAASEPPSKLGVRAGGSISVEQAILSLVTRSANDMATALGEYVGGNEARFAQMMTNKARALGMTRTTYRNANGLPNTAQMTTARDQARLGIALRQHFPQYYGYFNTRSFKFGKQVIGNHNRLVGTVQGVDGIKTGYTNAAGSNLVTSAQLDGRSIVGVVLGGASSAARDATMRKFVAQYLPAASRSGAGSNLIAQVRSAPAAPPALVATQETAPSPALQASGLDLPNKGPVPLARYDDLTTETAYTSTPTSPVARAAAAAIVSQPRHVLRAPDESSQAEETTVDAVTTASTSKASATSETGWVIQIGASPDKKMAMDLLQNAQDKGGVVLRTATPFTVAFNAGGAQVFRARFGGFGDQKTAANACIVLKKKGISCWASLQ